MCQSMVNIQFPTAEIRRGKEEETTAAKYNWPALLGDHKNQLPVAQEVRTPVHALAGEGRLEMFTV